MYLTENPEAEKLVKSSVDFILSIQKSNGKKRTIKIFNLKTCVNLIEL